MNRTWTALAAALVLTGSLTSCGWNNNNKDANTQATPNNPTTNSGMENEVQGDGQLAPDNNVNPNDNGSGTVNGDGNNNDTANAKTKRTSAIHRSAYDYLNDGRYSTDASGKISSNSGWLNVGPNPNLTQGARDLVRDGTNAMRKATGEVGEAARDTVNGVKQAGRDIGNTVRDVMQ